MKPVTVPSPGLQAMWSAVAAMKVIFQASNSPMINNDVLTSPQSATLRRIAPTRLSVPLVPVGTAGKYLWTQ